MIKKTLAAAIVLAVMSLIACGAGEPTAGATISAPPTPEIPMRTPAELQIDGRLLITQGKAGVSQLDLASGEVTALFQPPEDGLVSAASLSPDGKWLLMSYSPPESDSPQLGYTRLFIMPADGSSSPEPLLQAEDETGLLYTLPGWSPDGKMIIYGCFSPQDTGENASGFSVQRVAYPAGHPERLIADAYQPRLSADGSMLAYVGLTDPTTSIDELYVAGADGSAPRKLVPLDGSRWTIDAPVFSPDGRTVIFSGVVNQPAASTTWLDDFLGVRVAHAHNVPSDLWAVPVAGGEATILARLGSVGLYPDFSPDGKHIAFLSLSGIYVMKADGTQIAQISTLGGSGTLQWLP